MLRYFLYYINFIKFYNFIKKIFTILIIRFDTSLVHLLSLKINSFLVFEEFLLIFYKNIYNIYNYYLSNKNINTVLDRVIYRTL